MTTNSEPQYPSDAYLIKSREDGIRLGLRGMVRKADYMLRISEDLRIRASLDANELMNCVRGYTYCDALSVVIRRPEYLPHTEAAV